MVARLHQGNVIHYRVLQSERYDALCSTIKPAEYSTCVAGSHDIDTHSLP
jgi:hypothetical protein